MPTKKKEKKEEQKEKVVAKKPAEKKVVGEVPKKKINPISLPRGMRDILPEDQLVWDRVRSACKTLSDAYGFRRIDTPIVEDTNLFVRGVGKHTDIVEKEMYSLETEGGEKLTLRPEGTASVMRAYISNGMFNQPQPAKLWYMGPMFRHERPQSGRYRQFQTFGCEVIGEKDPVLDAQIILLSWLILKELGIKGIVRINSIGTPESRSAYKQVLVQYFRSHRSKLSDNDKRRLLRNPLRILDSKDEGAIELKVDAPQIVDWLDDTSKAHFMRVLEYLDEVGVPYQLDPYLVRGLDYYSDTVYELFDEEEADERSQSALGGGGRYDGLSELLGGREETGAVGFGLGMDRIVSRLKSMAGDEPVKEEEAPVFIAQLGEAGRKRSLAVFEELRLAGIRASEAFGKESIKAQMEVANRRGAKWAVIIGQKEVLDGTAILRDMDSGSQEIIDATKIVRELEKKL
ncbi:MAG: histidine--tRNA ligase [bacterium]|nr:histidine--tRNA ligase [bacterium]